MLTIDRTKYMTIQELQRLFDVTRLWCVDDLKAGRRHGVVAWIIVDYIAGTGFRPSELAGSKLLCQDVDIKRMIVHVERSKKKKKVIDVIPISKDLARHLGDFIRWKFTIGESIDGIDPLLVGQGKSPMGPRGIARKFMAALKRAGLDELYSVKSARHSMGVYLLKRTGNLRLVQKQLGHTKIETTSAYADVLDEDMRKSITGIYDE